MMADKHRTQLQTISIFYLFNNGRGPLIWLTPILKVGPRKRVKWEKVSSKINKIFTYRGGCRVFSTKYNYLPQHCCEDIRWCKPFKELTSCENIIIWRKIFLNAYMHVNSNVDDMQIPLLALLTKNVLKKSKEILFFFLLTASKTWLHPFWHHK